ncbi:MAG: 4Fe-4S dicluster domain-containing protein [Candidatus Bathyarchaeia archaeon]|jgi:electron transport complex protein RnfC
MSNSQTLEKPAKQQKTKTVACIRCGVCMRSCPHNLSPVLIKEAFDKNQKEKLKRLRVDLCEGCGNCTYVCPSRIDLRASVLRAKASVR